MCLYIPAREGDVCLRVVAIVVLTSQAMLRKARSWFRSVPSATLWKEKQAKDWAKFPGLSVWKTSQAAGFSYTNANKSSGVTRERILPGKTSLEQK